MMSKNSKRDLFFVLYFSIIFISFVIFFILFFLTEINIESFPYFIFVIVIIFSEGEIAKYFFKKEMLFFVTHAEYSKDKVLIKFERFLYLTMDITIIVLLILFIFFNNQYLKVISLVDRDKVRGGILLTLLIGACGGIAFWGHYYIWKWIRVKR